MDENRKRLGPLGRTAVLIALPLFYLLSLPLAAWMLQIDGLPASAKRTIAYYFLPYAMVYHSSPEALCRALDWYTTLWR